MLPDLGGGGVERVRLTLADAFMARGHAVDFVLMRGGGELASLLPQGAGLVDLAAPRLRNGLPPLARYLSDRRPDALLAAMWPLTSIAVWARDLSRMRTRIVVSDHNDYRRAPPGDSAFGRFKLRRTMRWSYPRAEGIVAVSAGVAETVAALADIPRDRVSVIHNPARAPSPAASSAGAPAATGWAAHDGPKLIAIGKLKEQKQFSLLLSAFAMVRSRVGARLLILGEGPLRGELEALIARLGLDGAVDLPGFVPDPHPYLARADLFVLSSAWEGFGNVILEALACGTPVVSTDCPSGPREILEDGRYGKLVPVGDAAALARSILASLGKDHDRTALMARAGEFSIDKAADKYLRLLLPGPA